MKKNNIKRILFSILVSSNCAFLNASETPSISSNDNNRIETPSRIQRENDELGRSFFNFYLTDFEKESFKKVINEGGCTRFVEGLTRDSYTFSALRSLYHCKDKFLSQSFETQKEMMRSARIVDVLLGENYDNNEFLGALFYRGKVHYFFHSPQIDESVMDSAPLSTFLNTLSQTIRNQEHFESVLNEISQIHSLNELETLLKDHLNDVPIFCGEGYSQPFINFDQHFFQKDNYFSPEEPFNGSFDPFVVSDIGEHLRRILNHPDDNLNQLLNFFKLNEINFTIDDQTFNLKQDIVDKKQRDQKQFNKNMCLFWGGHIYPNEAEMFRLAGVVQAISEILLDLVQ